MRHIVNYVRRCKDRTCIELHDKIHATDENKTFCGKNLDGMWFVMDIHSMSPSSVTCAACLRELQSPGCARHCGT